MSSFTDGGIGLVIGQKRFSFLMTMALIVLSLCFVGILLSDGVDSTEGDEFVDSGLVYRVVSDSDRTVTVFSSNTVPAELIIPDTVENDSIEYKVISIDGYAFGRQSGIISVDVGDNVRIIGQQAFNHCSSMTSISLPDGLVSIGKEAFLGCDSLNSITIPKNVSDIGDYVFDIGSLTAINVDVNNPNYSSVDGVLFDKSKAEIIKYPRGKSGETYTIPNTVVSIANGAFSECSLTSVSISGDLISIGDNSFEYCSKLTSIELPESLTSIGVSAFNECSKLAAIEIFSGVESISESAFGNCSALSSVTLSDDVKVIGTQAFENCVALVSIDLPESLEGIGACAFMGCTALESIVIPDKVVSIGPIDEDRTDTHVGAFEGCTKLASVTFGKSVETIGQRAFSGCEILAGIVLPDSVITISNNAFFGCGELTSIVVPNGVTEIGYSAFDSCTGLTSITIGDGVETIRGMAFAHCSNVGTLVIGNNVDLVETDVFFGMGKLTDLTMPISLDLSNGNLSDSKFFHSKSVVNITLTPGPGDGFDDYVNNFNSATLPWNYLLVKDTEVKKTFTLRFANSIDSLGAHDFDGFSFYDSDGITPLSNTVGDLCGYEYIGTYDRMVRQAVDSYECTVSFDANGGTGTMGSITVLIFDRFYPVCTFTPPSGKAFLGWALTSDGDAIKTSIGVSEDTTLYAVWGEKKVIVTFEVDGKEYDSFEIDAGTIVTPPKDPSKDGYVFRGWSPSITVPVLDDQVFTAVFAELFSVTYKVDGNIIETQEHAARDSVPVLERYVKEGYTVSEWTTSDVIVDDGHFIMGSKDVTFNATSTVNRYSVTYKVDGVQVGDAEEYDYATIVTLRAKYVKVGYDVSDWESDQVIVSDGRFTLGAEDVTFEATSVPEEYEISFVLADGTVVENIIVSYSEVIVAPNDPEMDGTDDLTFRFVGWEGFTIGMVATRDATFTAIFMAEPTSCPDPVNGDVTFNAEAVDEIQLGAGIMGEVMSFIGTGSSSLSILFNHGSISFDDQSLSELDGSEVISIKQVDDDDLPQNIASQVNDRPVFGVIAGDVHDFGDGRLTIRLRYDLGSNESGDHLEIWHYKADGSKVSEDCTYDENGGYVEFTTDNLSYFAIMYVEPTDNGGNDDGDDGGINIPLIAGIAVGIIAVIGIAAFLFFRRS